NDAGFLSGSAVLANQPRKTDSILCSHPCFFTPFLYGFGSVCLLKRQSPVSRWHGRVNGRMENMLVFLLNDKGMGAGKDVACVHLSIDFFVDPRYIKVNPISIQCFFIHCNK